MKSVRRQSYEEGLQFEATNGDIGASLPTKKEKRRKLLKVNHMRKTCILGIPLICSVKLSELPLLIV